MTMLVTLNSFYLLFFYYLVVRFSAMFGVRIPSLFTIVLPFVFRAIWKLITKLYSLFVKHEAQLTVREISEQPVARESYTGKSVLIENGRIVRLI